MFIVIELQTMDGVTSNLVTAFEDRADAEAKYHAVLSAGAKSKVSTHACIMVDERGNLEKTEYYLH